MELIKIYNGSLVNARELHEFLEVKSIFANWIKRMLEYGFEESKDYFTISKKENRQILKEYYLTIGTAKEIAMLQRNEKGKEARKYFIQCEETLHVLKNNKRFEVFFKLEGTKERLKQNILDIGGTHNDFLQIDFSGRKVLFNGDPVDDSELHIILLKGRDFATELTNQRLDRDNHDLESAKKLNDTHHGEIREMIEKNMKIKPENLPTEERMKKLGE